MWYQPSKSKNAPRTLIPSKLLKRYNTWVDNRKPHLAASELVWSKKHLGLNQKIAKTDLQHNPQSVAQMKVAQQFQYHIKVEQVKSYSTLYQMMSQVFLLELNLLKSILQQPQHHHQMRTFNLLFLRGLIKLHLVQLKSRTYQPKEK